MKNLLNIRDLSVDEISEIIKTAKNMETGNFELIPEKAAVLMFCENSTRTRLSFEMAAKNLGMKVLNFDSAKSSFSKGESLKSTIENLYYIGANIVILRHCENDLLEKTVEKINNPIKFINAGAGSYSHPSQALLDYYTMLEHLKALKGKKITIIGDIEHSRVARSNIELLSKFEADVHVCAPEYFKPSDLQKLPATYDKSLSKSIEKADVVMCLRIQKERLNGQAIDVADYIKDYQLTTEKVEKYAPNAIIMHPGPVNYDVEMSEELIESEKGKTILEQVRNGVYVRMAILKILLKEA